MFDFVGKRNWYFLISALIIVPGIVAMGMSLSRYGSPVRLSIDFTGGSLLELEFEEAVEPGDIRDVFVSYGLTDTAVQTGSDGRRVFIRSKPMEEDLKARIEAELREKHGQLTELRFESVGPTVGQEVARAAVYAVVAVAIAILLFIALAFRRVPKAFRYGVCAIIKVAHDILVSFGIMAILGLVANWEADALFLSAIMTVIGFSVQDVIVVFDRIRENIRKRRGESYEIIVNRSLLETLHRSLATQLNAIFVMSTILLFGGATIKQFIAMMLIGMVSGTYSSLFNAVPLLVVWENGELGRLFRRRQPA